MKRIFFIFAIILAVLLCRTPPAEADMTYGLSYYDENIAYAGSGGINDPVRLFVNEVETTMDGTSGMANLYLTPGTAPSSPAEGMLYANDAGNNLQYYNGTGWVDIDVSGASSLDTAYNTGNTIDVDGSAVTLTTTDTDDNVVLAIVQNEATNDNDALTVTMGTGAIGTAVEIDSQASGTDIAGDNWSVDQAGALIIVGIDTTGDITLENDEVIKNDNNGEIEFGNGTEDTAFAWGTNELQLSSDTGVVTVNWGDVDAFTGLNTIAFDGAVANTITQTGTGAGDDLTISQSTSGQDASLILQSSGTGTDALSLITTVADISLVSADNITRTAADNITDVTTDGAYTLTIGGSSNGKYVSTVADTFSLIAVDTVLIQNTEASKDITINSVLGSVLIEAEEDAANAVLITADGGTSSTLRLHNDTGTAATSIDLLSDVGGITATASAGPVVLTATGATAGDMTLTVGDDYKLIVTGEAFNGVDGTGFDTTWYGDTASSNMKWDQNGDTNGSLILTGASQTITGIDSGGNLLTVTGIDTTGNSDTIVVTHSGTGAALKMTSSEADTQLLELVSAANQTTWLEVIDGATGNWIGADNVGMLTLKADTALANAGASLLNIQNTAQPITAAEGFLARFVDTGTARTNAYAIDIEVTDTTGGINCDGHSTFTKGLQTSSQSVTATADGLTTGLIPDGASFVTVTSDTATKVVVLPTWVIGNVIRITVPATGAELQTLAASNDTINAVDCDGANEMAMAAASVYELVCVADSTWIAYGWGSDGAAQATIVPDTDS